MGILTLLLLLLLAPVSALGQGSLSCEAPDHYTAGSHPQNKIVKVREVAGMALLAMGGTDERHEIASVANACLAVYSVPEGRLIATGQTSSSSLNSGAFHFAGLVPGRYRLISLETPKSQLAPIDAPLELVKWPQGGVFKRARLYLHFRFLRSGVLSYASTSRQKSAALAPSYSARHNNSLDRSAEQRTL